VLLLGTVAGIQQNRKCGARLLARDSVAGFCKEYPNLIAGGRVNTGTATVHLRVCVRTQPYGALAKRKKAKERRGIRGGGEKRRRGR